jgi:hypothetical protein
MKPTKLTKCPRCNLTQEGMVSCQYCGYIFAKHEKKYTKTFRNRLKDIFAAFNKDPLAPGKESSTLKDNGGTRSGTDRRKYTFRTYFPKTDREGIEEKG